MRIPFLALILSVGLSGAQAQTFTDPNGGLPVPPGTGPQGVIPGLPSVLPRHGFRDDADPAPEAADGADTPESKPSPPPTRAARLDRLFKRLAQAADAEEAQSIAGLIQSIWMESGSPTADLLMTRALQASSQNRRDVAEALLDKILALEPNWAEAWNKRATLRFLDGDDTAAMADVAHVLALEPRHFGALTGMGTILARHGDQAGALTVLRRAQAIDPKDADLAKAIDKLVPQVEGQPL